MKNLILALLLFPLSLAANVAMPGIFQTGGSGSLSLLYPEDTTELGKIQMVQEKVAIDIYKGYAVIKGVYLLFNPSSDTITIRTGYPKYSFYEGRNIGGHFSMEHDSLNDLRVFINEEAQDILPVYLDGDIYDRQNWYTWESTFYPIEMQLVEVYFTMTTDMAMVREGYANKEINAVAYVLETGRFWNDSISEGEIIVQLKDGITFSDIHGISPTDIFKINEGKKLLLYDFEDLEPSYQDNLIIALKDFERGKDFPFDLNKRNQLYEAVDNTWSLDTDDIEWEEKTFPDPYNLPTPAIGWVFLAIVIILVLLGLAIIGYFSYRLYRHFKK